MANTPNQPAPAPQPRAQDFAAVRDWPGYYRAVAGKPARDTLTKALALFDAEPPPPQPRLAIDIGCGSGRDTFELLRRGWRVIATDSAPEAFDLLLPQIDPRHRTLLEHRIVTLENMDVPRAHLVNASYTLPFCNPDHFDALWQRILGAIPKGARFAGQLFGDRDGWASLPDRSHQPRPRVERMFADFVLESFIEEEKTDKDQDGADKPWHVFHIVARRR